MTNSNDENVDFIAREMGDNLFSRLEFIMIKPEKVIVLGDASEHNRMLLEKRYPEASILVEETEIIAVSNHSVDLLFANLFLAHCSDLKATLQEWKRIVKPQGLIMFSAFGPDTLKEFHKQYASFVAPYLIDMHDLGDEFIQARFADPVLDTENFTITYQELNKLQQEFQASHLLTSNAQIKNLPINDERLFPVSFEVIYGHAWRPNLMADQVVDASGVVKIPLAHLRRPK